MQGRLSHAPGLVRTSNDGRPCWAFDTLEKRLAEDSSRSILFVGDLSLARGVNEEFARDPEYQPFAGLSADAFRQCGAVVVNHEFSLSSLGQAWEPKPEFLRAPPELAANLKTLSARVVANLANNHFLDFGPEAAEQSVETLTREGIPYFGVALPSPATSYHVCVVGGCRVGLVGFAPAGHRLDEDADVNLLPYDPDSVETLMKQVAAESDIVIASLHQGIEYRTPVPRQNRKLARLCVDAGCAAVVCHHSHTINGVEWYRDRPIFHGIGNFLMDTVSDEHPFASFGLVLKLEIEQNRIAGMTIEPVTQGEKWRPRYLDEAEFAALEDYLRRQSRKLQSGPGSIINDLSAFCVQSGGRLGAMFSMLGREGVLRTARYYLDRLLGR